MALRKVKTLDILARAAAILGFRVSLESFVQATLGVGKMADGLQAAEWYRAGHMDKVGKHCRDDADLTRELYDFGRQNGKIYFTSRRSGRRREVPAYW